METIQQTLVSGEQAAFQPAQEKTMPTIRASRTPRCVEIDAEQWLKDNEEELKYRQEWEDSSHASALRKIEEDKHWFQEQLLFNLEKKFQEQAEEEERRHH